MIVAKDSIGETSTPPVHVRTAPVVGLLRVMALAASVCSVQLDGEQKVVALLLHALGSAAVKTEHIGITAILSALVVRLDTSSLRLTLSKSAAPVVPEGTTSPKLVEAAASDAPRPTFLPKCTKTNCP